MGGKEEKHAVRTDGIVSPSCFLIVPCVLPAPTPPKGGVLRSAPARGGSARQRCGATVAQAQDPLGASRAKLL